MITFPALKETRFDGDNRRYIACTAMHGMARILLGRHSNVSNVVTTGVLPLVHATQSWARPSAPLLPIGADMPLDSLLLWLLEYPSQAGSDCGVELHAGLRARSQQRC